MEQSEYYFLYKKSFVNSHQTDTSKMVYTRNQFFLIFMCIKQREYVYKAERASLVTYPIPSL
jgi:hypothetical protein